MKKELIEASYADNPVDQNVLDRLQQSVEKGGPGSGNFGHPGYPRGVAPAHHEALAELGFKHTKTTTNNGIEHHYDHPTGAKATHKDGMTTIHSGPIGSRIGPHRNVAALKDEYLSRVGATVAYRDTSKGGPGSGDFGHQGRPGEVGGSGSGGGGTFAMGRPELRKLITMREQQAYLLDNAARNSRGKAKELAIRQARDMHAAVDVSNEIYHSNVSDKEAEERIKALFMHVLTSKGGPGSGDFGHSGRPGEVGGSGSGGTSATATPAGAITTASMRPHADQLMARAKTAEPEITKIVKDVAGQTGSELSGLDHRLKTDAGRVAQKMAEKANLDNLTPEQARETVYDTVRYTMIMPESNYTQGIKAAVAKFKENGIEIYDHKDKNYWPTPGQKIGIYAGTNFIFQDKTGHKFEMQFHTKDSFAVKEANHKLYEAFRAEGASKQDREKYWVQMNSAWTKVNIPSGVHTIGTLVPGDKP